MYHRSRSSSPTDGDESSGFELSGGVVGHVVLVGTVLANQQPQIRIPGQWFGHTAVHQNQLTIANEASRDTRYDPAPVKPMESLRGNDGGVVLIERIVLRRHGQPFDMDTPCAVTEPRSREHRA